MPSIIPSQMIENLATHFQRRWEPNFAHVNAASLISMLPGLRAFWPMSANIVDAGGDQFISDVACNYHVKIVNTPQFGYDGLAPYVDFDGVNEYAFYADDNQFKIQGTSAVMVHPGLTIGGWFRFEVLGNPGVTNRPCITKWETANQNAYRLILRDATDAVEFSVSSTGANIFGINTAVDITVNRWMFLCGRFIPSTSVSVWENGTKTTLAAGIPAAIFNSTSQFEIGRGFGGQYLDGQASLCFVCASALSDVIINHIYQQSRALFGVR